MACHLKWANSSIKICPINIIPAILPYKNKQGQITKFEHIDTQFEIYQELVEHGLCEKVLNYVIRCRIPLSNWSSLSSTHHQRDTILCPF